MGLAETTEGTLPGRGVDPTECALYGVSGTNEHHCRAGCRRDHDNQCGRRRPRPSLPRPLRPSRTAWKVRSAQRVADQLADSGLTVTAGCAACRRRSPATIGTGDPSGAVRRIRRPYPDSVMHYGHNLISAITVGAACALAPLVDDLGITLRPGHARRRRGAADRDARARWIRQPARRRDDPPRSRRRRQGPTVCRLHSHISTSASPPTQPPTPTGASTPPTRSPGAGRHRAAAPAITVVGARPPDC